MNKLPTASEWISKKFPLNTDGLYVRRNLEESLIEYGRLCAKAALEAAADKALIDADPDEGPGVSKKEFDVGPNNGVSVNYTFSVQRNSILNAYPENLIV